MAYNGHRFGLQKSPGKSSRSEPIIFGPPSTGMATLGSYAWSMLGSSIRSGGFNPDIKCEGFERNKLARSTESLVAKRTASNPSFFTNVSTSIGFGNFVYNETASTSLRKRDVGYDSDLEDELENANRSLNKIRSITSSPTCAKCRKSRRLATFQPCLHQVCCSTCCAGLTKCYECKKPVFPMDKDIANKTNRSVILFDEDQSPTSSDDDIGSVFAESCRIGDKRKRSSLGTP